MIIVSAHRFFDCTIYNILFALGSYLLHNPDEISPGLLHREAGAQIHFLLANHYPDAKPYSLDERLQFAVGHTQVGGGNFRCHRNVHLLSRLL